jgi:hemin uptake protein HemP
MSRMNSDETDDEAAQPPARPVEPAAVSLSAFQPETSNHKSLPKIISFESLARCGEEIWIENNGQIYRLRRTRQGKLILTK